MLANFMRISMLKSCRHLRQDQEGAVLIWFTIAMLVIFAFIGLAIDGSAYMNLNTSQQELADAAAIAGANELDGSSGAQGRATTAAMALANNANRWSNIASGAEIANVYFYMTLADVASDTRTGSDKASYIKVQTVTRSYAAVFMRLVSTLSTVYSSASAVAGSQYVVCAPVQSFLCNPFEDASNNVAGTSSSFLSSSGAKVGDMFRLVDGSGGSPGDWGLIQPPGTSGNPNQNQPPWWSATGTSSCVAYAPGDYALSTSPGNTAKFAVDGMNVRFDTPVNKTNVDPISAPIVISGFQVSGGLGTWSCGRTSDTNSSASYSQTNPCTNIGGGDGNDCLLNQTVASGKYVSYCTSTTTGSCPLPRDRQFQKLGVGGTWGSMVKGSGANAADLDAYWANHHDGGRPTDLDTRWKIYQAEVSGAAPFKLTQDGREYSTPRCQKALPAYGVDRRLINVAVVDCTYYGMKGRSTLPTTTVVAKFFMTEPALSDGTIYGELVNVLKANDMDSPVRHLVRLVK